MSRYHSGPARRDPADARYKIPQARPGMLDREPRRTHDRPFEVDCDLTVRDGDGNVLLSVHQLPRSIYDGMDLVLRDADIRHAAKVVDIDRFYGLVAAHIDG
jgi:hypothetical protein